MKTCFYTPFPGCRSWFEMVDISVECGFDCLEVFTNLEFAEPDLDFAKKFRAYADSKGISICCLSSFVDITGPDREENIARLKKFGEIASILGSPYLHHTICCDFTSPDYALAHREELFALGVAGVREIFDHCRQFGVRAIYEDQAFIFNGLEGYGEFLAAADRPVGTVADFGNIRQKDEEILDFIEKFSDRIVHVHLKDSVVHPAGTPPMRGSYPTQSGRLIEETEPGFGTVPNREGIALLKGLGYDGICSIEWNSNDPVLRKTVADRVKHWVE